MCVKWVRISANVVDCVHYIVSCLSQGKGQKDEK